MSILFIQEFYSKQHCIKIEFKLEGKLIMDINSKTHNQIYFIKNRSFPRFNLNKSSNSMINKGSSIPNFNYLPSDEDVRKLGKSLDEAIQKDLAKLNRKKQIGFLKKGDFVNFFRHLLR